MVGLLLHKDFLPKNVACMHSCVQCAHIRISGTLQYNGSAFAFKGEIIVSVVLVTTHTRPHTPVLTPTFNSTLLSKSLNSILH